MTTERLNQISPAEYIIRHAAVQNAFDDVNQKLAEIADVFDANGFDTRLLTEAIAAVYEARTHVSSKSDPS